MVVGQVEVINEKGTRIGLFEPVSRFNYIDLLTMKTILPQQAALFSRAAYENVGPIRNDLHYAMDVEYFIRIGSHFSIIPLTDILASFRLSDTNKSNANRTRWPAEFINIVDDFFNQPGLDPNICSLRSRAFGGAYYRGAATFLECLELGTARKWFLNALRKNPYFALKPGWWKNLLKTFLGKAMNNKLLELKVFLRKKNLLVNEQDWKTGIAFSKNQ
jgi:hypothetical protein